MRERVRVFVAGLYLDLEDLDLDLERELGFPILVFFVHSTQCSTRIERE